MSQALPTDAVRRHDSWLVVAGTSQVGYLLASVATKANALLLHRPAGTDTFLFTVSNRFADYTALAASVRTGEPYRYPYMVYFPFATLVIKPFAALPDDVGLVVLGGLALATIGALVAFALPHRPLRDRVVLGACLSVSFPVLFAADRGNFEVVAFALLALFALSATSSHWALAAVGLAGAVAMKPTLGLFLVLFAVARQWRPLVLCVGLAGAATVAGLLSASTSPVTAVDLLRTNLHAYDRLYVSGDAGFAFSHSLFMGVKAVAFLVAGRSAFVSVGSAAAAASTVSGLLLVAVAVLLFVRRPPLAQGFTVACAATLLLTPVSADYRLLSLLTVLALLLREEALGGPDRLRRAQVLLLAALLVPRDVALPYTSESPETAKAVSVLVGALLVTALLGVAVLRTLRRPGAGTAVVEGPVVEGPVVEGPVVEGPVVEGPVVETDLGPVPRSA